MPRSVRFCFFLNYVQDMQPNPPVKDSQHASSHSPPCKGICFYGDWPNVWNHEVNPLELVVDLCLDSLRLKTPKWQSQALLKPNGYGCKQSDFPPPGIFHFPKFNKVKCIRQRSRSVFGSKTTQGLLCEIILSECDFEQFRTRSTILGFGFFFLCLASLLPSSHFTIVKKSSSI